MEGPKVSVVIPVKVQNKNLEECIHHCLQLDYPEFETIILPDLPIDLSNSNLVTIPTGAVGPSQKRDIALDHSKGDILAFLDDDTFPERNWLKNAVKYFDDNEVAAVGGPAITPESDNFLQKASGLVYSSFLGGGSVAYRYVPRAKKEVDDYPSCNFLVRRSVLEELGGFNCKYWPGEDTKLCKEITNNLNMKIIYAPDIMVYHHRRRLFYPHLRQVLSYAIHRGYFAKRFPETSRKLTYFIPTIFVLALLVGFILAFSIPIFATFYLAGLGFYLFLALLSSFNSRDIRMILLVFLGIIPTHIVYGIGFLRGLLARRLKEEA